MQAEKCIQGWIEQTRGFIQKAKALQSQDLADLSWREHPKAWNILECLEHLNRYGDYYLPEIEQAIQTSNTEAEPDFRPGLLGNYFAKQMLPREKLNKMKTFQDKNPLNADLNCTTIDRFIDQQKRLLLLLQQARAVSLNKVKVRISIARWIKLKLGDTFHFFINHQVRHFKQIEGIQKQMAQASMQAREE